MAAYLEKPDDEYNLVRKAFAVISKALAGRNCEEHPLSEQDVIETKDPKSGKRSIWWILNVVKEDRHWS